MRAGTSDIVLSLYKSLGQNPPFQGFLTNLSQDTRAQAAQLVLVNDAGQTQTIGAGPLTSEQLGRMRYLRAYSPDDMPCPQFFRALRTRAGAGEAWIVLARDGVDFSAAVSATLGNLAPHVAQAAEQYWTQRAQATSAAAMQDMAQRAGLGWAALSLQGAVIAAHNVPHFYIQGQKLRLPPDIQKQVVGAMEQGRSLTLVLGEMQLLVVPHQTQTASALLYFKQRRDVDVIHPEHLQSLFGLTFTEARFAAHIAASGSIQMATEALGFTTQTGRYYSKQLYAKLGISGLPQAVMVLQSSVYALV